jgi:hypothetical protein
MSLYLDWVQKWTKAFHLSIFCLANRLEATVQKTSQPAAEKNKKLVESQVCSAKKLICSSNLKKEATSETKITIKKVNKRKENKKQTRSLTCPHDIYAQNQETKSLFCCGM